METARDNPEDDHSMDEHPHIEPPAGRQTAAEHDVAERNGLFARSPRTWRRIALALVAIAVIACSTVPLTGRRQLMLTSSAQLASMGDEAYDEMLAGEKLLTRGAAYDQVLRVGRRIQAAAENGDFPWPARGTFEWEFSVIDNDEVANAWALPGGKVAVYTGIIKVAQDDAGLATVMGHEIAHAIAEHGGERMTQQAITQFGREAGAQILGSESETTMALFDQAFAITSNTLVLLPFSRKHESEADKIGLILMAEAGYDPRASVAFWERMAQGGGGQPPEFLSTHPSHETRISQLEKWMPEALDIYEGRASAGGGER